MTNRKLLLIDGNSVLYRSFYGIPLLSTSQGLYTNAVYGLAQMVLNLLKMESPTHVAVAFDKGKTTFRHAEFADYKGKRQQTPPELVGQFTMARDLLRGMNIPYVELDLFEADDIIGTLALAASDAEFAVTVVSGDKDLLQLVSDQVTACLMRTGTTDLARYDPAAVRDRYELDPKQIIDLKGLMGDTSDNIPGVPGVGEKTAIKLLKQFGSVERVLDSVSEISGAKLKERLVEHRDLALLSKRLATIALDVPLTVGIDDLVYSGYELNEVKQLFRSLDFKSLADRVAPWKSVSPLALDTVDVPDVSEAAISVVGVRFRELSIGEFSRNLLGDTCDTVVVLPDIEGHYRTGVLHGVVVCSRDVALYLRYGAGDSADAFVDLLHDGRVLKVLYDAKAFAVRAVQCGWETDADKVMRSVFDTLLATYLIYTSEGEPSLIDVITKALPEATLSEGLHVSVTKPGPQHLLALFEAGRHLLSAYPVMQKQLKELELESLYTNMELPLCFVLADMELYGVKLDTDRLHVIGNELAEGIVHLTKVIYDLAGTTFNIQSPKQLGEILFGKMGLAPIKKTKTGYSTSADVLEKLAPHSEVVSYILAYRQLSKLQSTYIEGLLRLVELPESRIRTSFHQAKTATGRLSSDEPNLQNIPIRMEEGRRLRQAFIPTFSEWVLLSADYSQVELRILAHLSQDTAMIEAFAQGIDIHTKTASDVFEVPLLEVTDVMRRQAKAVNFGIVYGISDYGLSQNLNISRAQAGAFIEKYFAKFPGIKTYMDSAVARAREAGYAETALGRRRFLPQINSRNFNERSFAERTAMNTPIQGTAADIIKLAMVQLPSKLEAKSLQSRLLLQVHDELIFECPEAEQEVLSDLVREEMEHAVEWSVPLRVDIHIGKTWYDAK